MLSPNVTYYYQFYMMVDGVTCKSDIRSFKTPGNVSITPAVTSFEVGENETYTIQQTVLPSNALVTWISSNPAVATVSNGVVTGVDGGTAVITSTATYGGMSARAQYTVSVNPIEYRAVIVGQYDYPLAWYEEFENFAHIFEDPKQPMPGAKNDANALARVLRYRATTLGEKPDVHLYIDLGAGQILDAIETNFKKSDYNDVNLFFFGGHGIPNHLICSNGDRVPKQALRNAYQNIKGHNVVLISACYSGSFLNLADDRPDSKFYVLASSAADQLSWNYTPDESVTGFGYYLLRAFGWDELNAQPLAKLFADLNGDNRITLDELFKFLAPRVADNRYGKDKKQNPCYSWADESLVIYEWGSNR
jgi:hypothetical protein